MWDAIKSDLFDFVSTITEDTTKTINIVLGDKEDEDVRSCCLSRFMLCLTPHFSYCTSTTTCLLYHIV